MSNQGDLKALYPFLDGKRQEPANLDAALLHSVNAGSLARASVGVSAIAQDAPLTEARLKEARMTAEARAREPRQAPQLHDKTSLSTADDRLRLSSWLPPQEGVIPRIRLGSRWINVLWAIPLVVALLIIGIAMAQHLRTMPGVQEFIARYPGETPPSEAVYSGFPLWLRLLHFFNFFIMIFIIRAGIQILADHPRLYWRRDCTPGTDWFRFQHEVPKDRVWTSKDDSVTIPRWLGIPGIRHSIGLARWWHFSFDLLWVINGAIFYVLLFTTDQWQQTGAGHLGRFPQRALDGASISIAAVSLSITAGRITTACNNSPISSRCSLLPRWRSLPA